MVPRKGFASGSHAYDVWRIELVAENDDIKTLRKDKKLIGSFVTKADAIAYCKYKNKEPST